MSPAALEAQERVQTLIDGEGLRDAVFPVLVGVVPAFRQLDQGDAVGAVAIHLVCGHVNERRVRTVPAAGLQDVQGAAGVGIEVVEGNGGGAVVRGLGGGVDDQDRGGPL